MPVSCTDQFRDLGEGIHRLPSCGSWIRPSSEAAISPGDSTASTPRSIAALRHPVDRRRLPVLGDRQPAASAYRGCAGRAVGAHAGQDDRDACPAGDRGDALEQGVTGRTVMAGDVPPVEEQPPGAGQLEVRAGRRDPRPGPATAPLLAIATRSRTVLVEPVGQPLGEPGADVLDDQDRDRVVGRERSEQAGQDLRPAR